MYNGPMSEHTGKPEEIVMDAEAEERFKNLVRKAATTPVSEEQKQAEKEYMAKHFTSKGKRRAVKQK